MSFHSPQATPFAVKPILAFWFFLAANLVSAAYSPIEDCDETFNYWEPTHYLSHGYGLQTWEYSPNYSIRSWLYVAIHAIIGSFRRLLPFPSKVRIFFACSIQLLTPARSPSSTTSAMSWLPSAQWLRPSSSVSYPSLSTHASPCSSSCP